MRTLLVIIIVIALGAGAIFYFTKNKSTGTGAVDGTISDNASANAKAVDNSTLLGGSRHVYGNPTKVTIVEFSDFQCPYCSTAAVELKKIVDKNKDQVGLVFRHFPLSFHQFAQKASEAAEAAGAQNPDKFWQMYDKLFANQSKFSDGYFYTVAKEIGLDEAKFKEDFDGNKYSQVISSDYQDGLKAGVQGTPTIFINGKQAQYSSYSDLGNIVEKALK